MLINIEYIKTQTGPKSLYYLYKLIDKSKTERFEVMVPTTMPITEQRVAMQNGVLEFAYGTYRGTSECPFSNIKRFYEHKGFQFGDNIVRQTSFYKKHSKVMDKFLRPVAIAPSKRPGAYGYMEEYMEEYMYVGASAGTTTSAFNINYNAANNTYTTATTINVAYPTQYISLNVSASRNQ